MGSLQHINILVTGKVQGVFFRAATKAMANQMGVCGIVRNEKDGSVYIEAEGEKFMLDELITWCHEGPDKAIVENVVVSDGEVKNYINFEIVKR